MGTTFYHVVDIALKIECICSQGIEFMMRDKRPHRFGSSGGTSSGCRGQFSRGHHGRPDHVAHHGARGVLALSSFITPVLAPFSALPVSLYRTLSAQGSSSGY